MIRFFTAFLCAIALMLGTVTHARAGADEVKSFIDSIAKETLAVANDRAQPLSQRRSQLEKIFLDNVDLDWVAKFTLGKYWRDATDEQKARYLQAYRQFAAKSYSSKFDDYNNYTYKITETMEENDARYLVRMEIGRPNQQSLLVDYHVKDNGGKYLVCDMTVEGVSMVTSQRSEFGAVAGRRGVDGLIADLQAKASQMEHSSTAAKK